MRKDEIVELEVNSLIPYARNNKIHNRKQLDLLQNELKELGINNWRFCKENSNYVVTDCGKVISICRNCKTWAGEKYIKYRTKILKGSIDKYGYKTVRMIVEDKKRHIKVHRLIMNAFVENKNNLPTVNHLDGNKTNNNLNNLEWASYSRQMQHSFDEKLRVFTEKQKDAAKKNIKVAQNANKGRVPHNKLSKEQENKILEKYKTIFNFRKIAILENVSHNCVRDVLIRRGVLNK